MIQAFLENAALLGESFSITPLLYGSLGLEYLTGHKFYADDIDILIPQRFLQEQWVEFRKTLEDKGYRLTDLHEHTFEKNGFRYSYASLEELEPFAGISMDAIATVDEEGVSFKLLSLSQYLCVYSASAKDGYRLNVKEKQDVEKIEFIKNRLGKEFGNVLC